MVVWVESECYFEGSDVQRCDVLHVTRIHVGVGTQQRSDERQEAVEAVNSGESDVLISNTLVCVCVCVRVCACVFVCVWHLATCNAVSCDGPRSVTARPA